MAPAFPRRILITGSTGFVGGTILQTIYDQHPESNITVLVRRREDAEKPERRLRPEVEPEVTRADLCEEWQTMCVASRNVEVNGGVNAGDEGRGTGRYDVHCIATA